MTWLAMDERHLKTVNLDALMLIGTARARAMGKWTGFLTISLESVADYLGRDSFAGSEEKNI